MSVLSPFTIAAALAIIMIVIAAIINRKNSLEMDNQVEEKPYMYWLGYPILGGLGGFIGFFATSMFFINYCSGTPCGDEYMLGVFLGSIPSILVSCIAALILGAIFKRWWVVLIRGLLAYLVAFYFLISAI